MKQLFLPVSFLAVSIGLLSFQANGQSGGGYGPGDPVPVPLCGDFLRENVQTQKQGHNDFGQCNQSEDHWEYRRTVTEKIYEHGSKYYCTNWATTGECRTDCAAFADCPSHTCSNPEPNDEPGCCGS